MRTVLAAGFVLLASGCAPDSAPVTVDLEAERAALRQAATAFHEAASAKRVDDVVALYDPEAMMVPPGDTMVRGIEGVRNYRFGFIETPGVELSFDFIRVEVSASGDMGWTLALGDITVNRPDGPPGRDKVRDFHTWAKQPDGSWKITVDIWNSEPPAGD